ncbi:MAG: IS1 family transposase [Chitinophagia bacterium]|nr:IS1 family transposase [Chitinophagia bacterium]
MVDYCPKCKSKDRVKNGHVNGRARFKCKGCGHSYTVMQKSTAVSADTKRIALQLYLEGMGFNAIGRILKVSHVAVLKWIKQYGQQAEELKSDKEIEVLEIDEMHSYIGSKKNYIWIWIAVDRYGKRFVNFVLGKRNRGACEKLWKEIESKSIGKVMTDFWEAYVGVVPKDKHIQSKAETYTVEGYNSRCRHFLARMRRKTKCYTKSLKMLEYSIRLLMLKHNGQLNSTIII